MADTFATCLNNVSTTLASNHAIADGQLTVADASGVTISGTQWVRVTLVRNSDNAFCIYKCTTVTGNVLSGLTAIEGKTDITGTVGDKVELRITAGHFIDIHNNLLYSTTTPVTAPVGGITSGQTFTTTPVTTVIDMLLHPYQIPAFSSFSISGAANQEVGQVFSGSKTFSWGTTNSGNVQANSITIKDTTNSVTLATGLANTGSTVISISVTKSTPASNVWTIQAQNTLGTNFSTTTTINWYYRLYYGLSSSVTLNAAAILALTGNTLTSTRAATYSFGAGNYKYFAWPDSFGGATSFKDTSTNLNVAMADNTDNAAYSNLQNGFYYALVSVTNAYSITTNYRVYRSKNILGGSINIIVA